MKIQILSIKAFKYYKKYLDKNIKVIVSTSSNDKLKEVKRKNKLVLYYDDITSGKRAFNVKHAKQIKRFMKKISQKNTIYCLCDAGISRSSAIAAVLSKYYNGNDSRIWNDWHYEPNKHIYKMLSKEVD